MAQLLPRNEGLEQLEVYVMEPRGTALVTVVVCGHRSERRASSCVECAGLVGRVVIYCAHTQP